MHALMTGRLGGGAALRNSSTSFRLRAPQQKRRRASCRLTAAEDSRRSMPELSPFRAEIVCGHIAG
jgi:hypothetical protein